MSFGQTPPLNLFSSSHPSALTLFYCIILFLLLVSRICLILTAALVSDRPSRLAFSIFLSFLSRWIQPRGCVVARTGGLAASVLRRWQVSVSVVYAPHTVTCECVSSQWWVLRFSQCPFISSNVLSFRVCVNGPPSCCHDRGEETGTEREREYEELVFAKKEITISSPSSKTSFFCVNRLNIWGPLMSNTYRSTYNNTEKRRKMEKGGPLWVICLFYYLRLHGGVYKYTVAPL